MVLIWYFFSITRFSFLVWRRGDIKPIHTITHAGSNRGEYLSITVLWMTGIFFLRNIGMPFFLRTIHIASNSAVELVVKKRLISVYMIYRPKPYENPPRLPPSPGFFFIFFSLAFFCSNAPPIIEIRQSNKHSHALDIAP